MERLKENWTSIDVKSTKRGTRRCTSEMIQPATRVHEGMKEKAVRESRGINDTPCVN